MKRMIVGPLLAMTMLVGCGETTAPAAAPPSVLNEIDQAATEAQRAPRFDPVAVEAMKKKLLAEPKIVDLLFDPSPLAVTWQIGVRDDGTSRIGYAGYVCQQLRENALYDDETNVRIVDIGKVNQGTDFRSASLGHVACKDERDLGV